MNDSILRSLIDQLGKNSEVDLIRQEDARYDQARLVYNRMHDCYPGIIIRTLNIDALRWILQFAAKHQVLLAIRGGGHHIGGFGTCNKGILIDFSPFKGIKIDEENQIVSVEPGVCLGDIDEMLAKSGYILPTGTVSQTGLAGLTLGGGIGWLIGKYGLTCDQLCGADLLLANGQWVKAEENPDLLWALKGGGGNFGLVTTFRYRLNPLPQTICGTGFVAWPDRTVVISKLINYLDDNCPNSISIAPVFYKDEAQHLQLRIDFCAADATEEAIAALLALSIKIDWRAVGPWDFPLWQKYSDAAFLPPLRGYWKAGYYEKITLEMIDTLSNIFERSAIARFSILLEHLHGAFKNYNQETSAFPLRHCNYGILLCARWEDSIDDEQNIQFVRQSFKRLDPKALSATYLNYSTADDKRAVQTLLSRSCSKIGTVKAYYDPGNLFSQNHNIKPGIITRSV